MEILPFLRELLEIEDDHFVDNEIATITRAAVVHLNFRAGSTFPFPFCTVSPGHLVNKADTQ